ncbi:uclacyanin 1-like [Rhododendron vialii]|uniref:uclacyanin 1-like n=1 Tax=Rhododendron vialii TaxID=182163 RepID=UPI00265E804C|nr:uclacyanin 1-like [Rhododendron vialii]
MAMLRIVASLAVMAMIINVAMAATYNVGSPSGSWDTSTDLASWSSSKTFLVGDRLAFTYPSNHDVVEVPKTDYDSCQTTNSIQTYNGGNTVIPLSSPGKRYFICGTFGHCSQGMKVEIDTLATSTSPTRAPTPETGIELPHSPAPSHVVSPTESPSLSRSANPSSSSAATLANTLIGSIVGFGFAMVMLLSL